MAAIPIQWESIYSDGINEMFRCKVVGGWLVKNVFYGSVETKIPFLCEMEFVSDPEWSWEV